MCFCGSLDTQPWADLTGGPLDASQQVRNAGGQGAHVSGKEKRLGQGRKDLFSERKGWHAWDLRVGPLWVSPGHRWRGMN